MRIEDLLVAQARRTPDAVVCKIEARCITYGELDRRSKQLAAALRVGGLTAGDRVVVALRNGLEQLEAMFATARASLVMVPVNPASTVSELRFILEDSKARAIILHHEQESEFGLAQPGKGSLLVVKVGGSTDVGDTQSYEPLLAGTPQLVESVSKSASSLEPWLLAYTSGSTGRPKGVVLSHRAKYLSAVVEALEARLASDDVGLVNTPMFHVHGVVFALMMIAAGGSIIFTTSSTAPETLNIIATEKVTQLSMVPTIYRAFVDASQTGNELSSVRIARCTGAPLTASLRDDILTRFPDLPLFVLYGATEAGAISMLGSDDLARKDGSVGQPVMGVELQARNDKGAKLPAESTGEIYIRSDYLCTGYYRNQELPDGEYQRWISLGDIGLIDDEGFLFLKGRASDIIISGGENISAPEVEAALERNPAVKTAAVIGVAEFYWGETVKAFVELRSGKSADPAELIESAAEYIARYKLPKVVEISPGLPRNAFGKIDKRSLKGPVHTRGH